MKKWIVIALFSGSIALADTAFADTGTVTLSPAVRLERGVSVGINQPIEIQVKSNSIRDQGTATLNITRGGRPVGEYPLKRDGDIWTTKSKLEFPGPHVLTVRVFDKERVWAAAMDLTALRPESRDLPKTGSASENLEFTVTSGKVGSSASGWLGILPLVVLIGAVGIGTQVFRKRTAPKTQTPS
jgi:hypothetical protein